MFDFNQYNKNLTTLFLTISEILNKLHIHNFNSLDSIIKYILLICINNIYLLNKIIIQIKSIIYLYILEKKSYISKLKKIEISLNNMNTDVIDMYNKLSIKKKYILNINLITDVSYIDLLYNKKDNLEIYELIDLDNLINSSIISNKSEHLKLYKKDTNFIDYTNINIGFGNFYKLHCYKYLNNNLPFNLLIYVQELDQIIIKVGNNDNFQYINSKLYKVYNTKNDYDIINNNTINCKSILCNNNIKSLNKKCYIENCKYYHDYILGYKDNYHKDRQFSSNPIVYNCSNFKDGSKIKNNIKNIEWHNAINLYQSSLSNILIGCIHSIVKKK
jgi:hypothetical protein